MVGIFINNMKYIITESKMENMIKNYLLNNVNDVVDVEFGTKRVHLGSGPNKYGKTNVDQKVIMITIDNVKNEKTNFHRILSGLLDIHAFFIKGSNTSMCSYVNDWNYGLQTFNNLKFKIIRFSVL